MENTKIEQASQFLACVVEQNLKSVKLAHKFYRKKKNILEKDWYMKKQLIFSFRSKATPQMPFASRGQSHSKVRLFLLFGTAFEFYLCNESPIGFS